MNEQTFQFDSCSYIQSFIQLELAAYILAILAITPQLGSPGIDYWMSDNSMPLVVDSSSSRSSAPGRRHLRQTQNKTLNVVIEYRIVRGIPIESFVAVVARKDR